LETVKVPEDLPDDLLAKLLAERERWVGQIDERTVWLVDHWQRFALTYVGLAGVRSVLAEYAMVARGVWLSGRSLEERVRLLKELTEPIQNLYFTARWRMVTSVFHERARLRKALDSLAEGGEQPGSSAPEQARELPRSSLDAGSPENA